MKDGRRALCGIKCAINFFGSELARGFALKLDEEETNQRRDELLSRTRASLPDVWRAIQDVYLPMERLLEAPLWHLQYLRHHLRPGGLEGDAYVFWETFTERQDFPDGSARSVEVRRETGRVRGVRLLQPLKNSFSVADWSARQIMSCKDAVGNDMTPDQSMRRRRQFFRGLDDGIDWMKSAAGFYTKNSVRQLNRLVVSDRMTAPGFQDESSVALRKSVSGQTYFVLVDRLGVTQRFPIPDLSKLPTREELVAPLRGSREDEETESTELGPED